MSLAYSGPSTVLLNVVGRDAFLEALGDPSLRLRIQDMIPASMEEALRIALNLEALDQSKEAETRALSNQHELIAEEPWKKKKFAKVVAKPVLTSVGEAVATTGISTLADIMQLKEALAKCAQQIELMLKGFVERSQLTPPVQNRMHSWYRSRDSMSHRRHINQGYMHGSCHNQAWHLHQWLYRCHSGCGLWFHRPVCLHRLSAHTSSATHPEEHATGMAVHDISSEIARMGGLHQGGEAYNDTGSITCSSQAHRAGKSPAGLQSQRDAGHIHAYPALQLESGSPAGHRL